MSGLVLGAPVQVNKVWAGGLIPLKAWVSGYVLRAVNGALARVEITDGTLAGVVVTYPLVDVRPVVFS